LANPSVVKWQNFDVNFITSLVKSKGNTEKKEKKFNLHWAGAARTQAPSATNYDVGCST